MKNLLFATFSIAAIGTCSMAFAGADAVPGPCEKEAKGLVGYAVKIGYPRESGYLPRLRKYKQLTGSDQNGDADYVIDMAKSDGQILGGGHNGDDGGVAYEVVVSIATGSNGTYNCSIESLKTVDEPEFGPAGNH